MKDERADRPDRPASGEGRERKDIAPRGKPAPETDPEPAPGIEHEPEPDAENIVPAKDRPGTL